MGFGASGSLPGDPKKEFGAYIRERRQVLNMTIRQLAEAIGLSPSYVRDIELGNRQAPKKQLDQLAQVLQIPEDDMFTFYDLAGASRGHQYEDLNPYLEQSELARAALRLARDKKLDDEAWKRIISEISRQAEDEP